MEIKIRVSTYCILSWKITFGCLTTLCQFIVNDYLFTRLGWNFGKRIYSVRIRIFKSAAGWKDICMLFQLFFHSIAFGIPIGNKSGCKCDFFGQSIMLSINVNSNGTLVAWGQLTSSHPHHFSVAWGLWAVIYKRHMTSWHQEIVENHIRWCEPPKCIVDGCRRYELVIIL